MPDGNVGGQLRIVRLIKIPPTQCSNNGKLDNGPLDSLPGSRIKEKPVVNYRYSIINTNLRSLKVKQSGQTIHPQFNSQLNGILLGHLFQITAIDQIGDDIGGKRLYITGDIVKGITDDIAESRLCFNRLIGEVAIGDNRAVI